MTVHTECASEETVKDFIAAAKSIPGVNLTPRDEYMLKWILANEKITDGGIEITFTQRKIIVASHDIKADYVRR